MRFQGLVQRDGKTAPGRQQEASRARRHQRPLLPEHGGAGQRIGPPAGKHTASDEVVAPPDLAEALAADPTAGAAFARLSYSHKRQHVLAIEEAKTAATRQQRIEKALSVPCEG